MIHSCFFVWDLPGKGRKIYVWLGRRSPAFNYQCTYCKQSECPSCTLPDIVYTAIFWKPCGNMVQVSIQLDRVLSLLDVVLWNPKVGSLTRVGEECNR